MATYTIYLGAKPIASIAGSGACFSCFEAAMSIAEITGQTAALVHDGTGAVICDYDPEAECEAEEREEHEECHVLIF